MDIRSNTGMYTISVAAELAGMHPQTLRQYDRIGLVVPQRTRGRGRRYSPDDVEKLRLIQRLSQEEGINLAGIRKILELRQEVDELDRRARGLAERLSEAMERLHRSGRVFAAGSSGDVVTILHGKRPEVRIAGALMPGTTGRNALRRTGAGSGRAERDRHDGRGELVVYRRFSA
jgi:MerR family transcriptional regulator, heat shock protein HspR